MPDDSTERGLVPHGFRMFGVSVKRSHLARGPVFRLSVCLYEKSRGILRERTRESSLFLIFSFMMHRLNFASFYSASRTRRRRKRIERHAVIAVPRSILLFPLFNRVVEQRVNPE